MTQSGLGVSIGAPTAFRAITTPNKLLPPKAISCRLGVSSATVYRLINEGRIAAHKVRGQFRITEQAVADYWESTRDF